MALPSWVAHDERKPAPQPLLLAQAFVNTRDLGLGTDVLAEPGQANAWLREAGMLGTAATADRRDLVAAREFREDIRALLIRNGCEAAAAPGDLHALTEVTRQARPELTIDHAGQIQLAPPPHGRLEDGLLRVLLIIRDAQRDDNWRRLKACGNDDCRWAFYDRSHSFRGMWCDMASCGNLIKNRNLRARRGAQA